MRQVPRDADRLLVVLSDVEMGDGGVLDDFPHSAYLADLLDEYNAPPYTDLQVDLVFDGDTFDLLKTAFDGAYPSHIDARIAVAKLQQVLRAHPAFVRGVQRFLDVDGRRKVHFIVGNHDAELVFPSVQQALKDAIGRPGVSFPGFALEVGDVRIEHGSQGDPMFRVNEQEPFAEWQGEPVLALPWGSIGIIDVLLPMQQRLYPLDRVRPRGRVFDVLPEFRELLGTAFWRYWTRDYVMEVLRRSDPLRKASWSMVKEVMHRFRTFDPHSSAGSYYRDQVVDHERLRVWVIGHLHVAGWWTWADAKIVQLGCLRDEYAIDPSGRITRPISKVYAEVFLQSGHEIRSQLVEVHGPAVAPGVMPDSIAELRDTLRAMIEAEAARKEITKAERARLRDEAKRKG